MVPELWGKHLWEKVRPYLDMWDSVRLRKASTHWNAAGKYGPHDELFFFGNAALMGLHLLVAEYEMASSGGQSPYLGCVEIYVSKKARF